MGEGEQSGSAVLRSRECGAMVRPTCFWVRLRCLDFRRCHSRSKPCERGRPTCTSCVKPRSTPRTAQGTRGCERAEEGSAEMVGGRLLPERGHALSGNRGRVQARASRREHQRLVLCFV